MGYLAHKVMSTNIVSIFEDRDIKTAERLMTINNFRHLPVVNINNELTGIVSIKDILKARQPNKSVKTIMASPVYLVRRRASVKEVIEIMLKKKVSSVLVGDENNLIGIVTTDDLLKLLHQMLEDTESIENMEVESFFDDNWVTPSHG